MTSHRVEARSFGCAMLWNLLLVFTLIVATGICVTSWSLRLAWAEDGTVIALPLTETPLESAWHDQPVQTFALQVQVARYWQPPFRSL